MIHNIFVSFALLMVHYPQPPGMPPSCSGFLRRIGDRLPPSLWRLRSEIQRPADASPLLIAVTLPPLRTPPAVLLVQSLRSRTRSGPRAEPLLIAVSCSLAR